MRVLTEITANRILLDAHDKKILQALAQDARQPVTKIAKQVRLSRDAIAYRLKMYEAKGLIQGYRTVVDIEKFGYSNYHLLLELNKPSQEFERTIIAKLKVLPFVRAILRFSGKYDLEIAIIAASIQTFQSYMEEIVSICSRFLLDYEVVIITQNYKQGPFPKNFIETVEEEKKKNKEVYQVDDKDLKILGMLANDARRPLFKISESLDLSADAVSYRIKRMVNSGYITRFVPAINYQLLGYNVYAVLMDLRSFSPKEDATLREFFRTDRNILWAVKTIGKYNILFYITTTTPDGVHETMLHLREQFPEKIRGYETFIASEQYKYTYFPEELIRIKN